MIDFCIFCRQTDGVTDISDSRVALVSENTLIVNKMNFPQDESSKMDISNIMCLLALLLCCTYLCHGTIQNFGFPS